MRTIYLIAFLVIMCSISAQSQVKFKVFHGINGETQVYDMTNKEVSKPIVRMKQGESFIVKVITGSVVNYAVAYFLKLINKIKITNIRNQE